MTIASSDNYYCVHVPSASCEMIEWRRDNPKASFDEQKAEHARRKARNADRHLRLKEKGYPRERNFRHKEIAERYAREIEAECGFRPEVNEQFDVSF